MFGYTDAQLDKVRRDASRRLRWWVVLLQLLPFSVWMGLVAGLDFLQRPDDVRWFMVHRAMAKAPVTVSWSDVSATPAGTLTDWTSWRFVLLGFQFNDKDPLKPDFEIGSVVFDLPEPQLLEGCPTHVMQFGRFKDCRFDLHFDTLRGVGLRIQAYKQRPGPKWTEKTPALRQLAGTHVKIFDAGFNAPKDDPIGEADIQGMNGDFHDVSYNIGARLVNGPGELTGRAFRTGGVFVHDIHLPQVLIRDSSLFMEGTLKLGEALGKVQGQILEFTRPPPAVTMHLSLSGANLKEVVHAATGENSPVDGALDLELTVQAGGDRPRGQSEISGSANLRDGRIELDRRSKYLIVDLVRVAPWVRLNANYEIELREMRGDIQFTRGRVTLKGLTYPAGKRSLRVDGRIKPDDIYFLVRLLPREDRPEQRPMGLVVLSRKQGQFIKFATRVDMERPDPWNPYDPATSAFVPVRREPNRVEKRKAFEGLFPRRRLLGTESVLPLETEPMREVGDPVPDLPEPEPAEEAEAADEGEAGDP